MSGVFRGTDLLRIATAGDTTNEIKRLAYYCLELREVLHLIVDDEPCELDGNGHCVEHETFNWDDEGCPVARCKSLLSDDIGDEPTCKTTRTQ